MGKFPRGTVVMHKVMGRGVAIDETSDGQVKVRMVNGVVETFYPEELETEEELDARLRAEMPPDDRNWRIGS